MSGTDGGGRQVDDFTMAVVKGIAAELKGIIRGEVVWRGGLPPIIRLYGIVGPPFERLGDIIIDGDTMTLSTITATLARTTFPLADPDCVTFLLAALRTMVAEHRPPSIEDVAKRRLGRRRR